MSESANGSLPAAEEEDGSGTKADEAPLRIRNRTLIIILAVCGVIFLLCIAVIVVIVVLAR